VTLVRKVSTLTNNEAVYEEFKTFRHGWGSLLVRPQTKTRVPELWVDLLIAVGHPLNTGTTKRANCDATEFLYTWLSVTQIQHVAILGAQQLNSPGLTACCTLLTSLGITVWLIYDTETNGLRHETELGLAMIDTTIEQLIKTRQKQDPKRAPKTTPRTKRNTASDSFPTVPDVHFLVFQSYVDELLTIREIRFVRAVYNTVLAAATTWFKSNPTVDEPQLVEFLSGVLHSESDRNKMLTIIRAAQMAAFNSGFFLDVDQRFWFQRRFGTMAPLRLSTDDWQRVALLQNPRHAATATLATLGLQIETISRLPAENVAATGQSVGTGSGQAATIGNEDAQRILRAQHIYRAFTNTQSGTFLGDPMDKKSNRNLSDVIRSISAATNIQIRAKHTRHNIHSTSGWRHRNGITIRDLTT
jgi:hypothetical protein